MQQYEQGKKLILQVGEHKKINGVHLSKDVVSQCAFSNKHY